MENEKQEKRILIQQIAIKFLGDEKALQERFLSDTQKPQMRFAAPPDVPAILWGIYGVLYQNSHLIYGIIASIVISITTYYIGRKASREDKKQIISKIEEVLQGQREIIQLQINQNGHFKSKLRRSLRWQFLRIKNPKIKKSWEAILTIYTEKERSLLDVKNASETIAEILEINEVEE
jgi:hypothetical protein